MKKQFVAPKLVEEKDLATLTLGGLVSRSVDTCGSDCD